eukprot:jgi/Undpi1/7973/HiC_scaffold_24.g10445.m1
MPAGKLEGKVALVTGASTGIGKASAIAFAKDGAKVVLSARTEAKLQAVADEIKAAGGEAVVVAGDVSKEADCKRMVDVAVEKFGGLHVAFNNAGVFETGTFADITEDALDKLVNINFKSLVYCFKYQIPAMAKSGDKGSIIVNSSCTASRVSTGPAMNGGGVYAASKAGADMLMKYAAVEGAASGVRVNSVAPGHVETPIYEGMPTEMLNEVAKANHLIGRPIQPDEIAKVVTFLASDDSTMVTGSVYLMDAGWSIKA